MVSLLEANQFGNPKMETTERRRTATSKQDDDDVQVHSQRPIERLSKFNCDYKHKFANYKLCDPWSKVAVVVVLVCHLLLIAPNCIQVHCQQLANQSANIIIIDQQPAINLLDQNSQHLNGSQSAKLPGHLQPASVFLAQNRSINFTHLTLDELTGSLYVGATNWLFQLASGSLRLETALRTGPHVAPQLGQQQHQQATAAAPTGLESSNSANNNNNLNSNLNNLARDCSPADCQAQLTHVQELELIPASHAHHTNDLRSGQPLRRAHLSSTLHTAGGANATGGYAQLTAQRRLGQQVTPTSKASQQQQQAQSFNQQQQTSNNYNKLLTIDYAARQVIVCGSLNQGACRRHQLGRLANFSELIALPVVPNDEQSSSVGLVVSGGGGGSGSGGATGRPSSVFYVAATNSRLGPYRELVPAISARYLDSVGGRVMQIIERSFTDTARVDISSELRDYYLVNYVHSFQHNDFVYFATQQRRSPLRQLEESGYVTRLGRLCLNDLSFQSYVEMTLECATDHNHQSDGSGSSGRQANRNNKQQSINYNLLQDAHLMSAGSQLQQQLGLTRTSNTVLVGSFALSKDHTTKSSAKSAICMFPMDKVEQRFNENIQLCFNGTSKSRNMDYIAGSVNDCPRMKSANSQLNVCSEPVKLNGSLALRGQPVIAFDNELITSVASTLAPTSPVNLRGQRQQQQQPQRQHQVLVAGTSEGVLKRIVLVNEDRWPHQSQVRGLEFDSIQVDDTRQSNSILADMHLVPSTNPQLVEATAAAAGNQQQAANRLQYVIAATAHKIVKLPVNSCKAPRRPPSARANVSSSLLVDDCLACAQLQDPFCGWCASSGSCVTRDECQQQQQQPSSSADLTKGNVHWTPFDSIKCSYYKPISPQFVPMEAELNQQLVEVNIKLAKQQLASPNQLSAQLAHTQFACHFDYSHFQHLSLNQSHQRQAAAAGATTKAGQARVNWDAGTATVGCPLGPRPRRLSDEDGGADSTRVRLSVRMLSPPLVEDQQEAHLLQDSLPIERELTLYQCSGHQDCGACLSAGDSGRRWSCSWCPLSQRCTFNASHPDLGCAASAVGTTTTTMASTAIRGSHLSASLDRAQANMLAVSVDRLDQCPGSLSSPVRPSGQQTDQNEAPNQELQVKQPPARMQHHQQEILIPNNVRRAIQVQLRQSIGSNQAAAAKRVLRLECLVEFEGVKARFSARLLDNLNVLCQEQSFSYLTEVATLRAQLSVILNDNQVIETTEVILYKCHLFGVNPPALTSSFGAPGSALQQQSSASSWRAHQLADLMELAGQAASNGRQSDCSLCANVERKFQCAWCSDTCSSAELCQEMPASTCPPPRIDSIRPNSGPLEGGTLLTIEGSNLGSNEREIQDKISVGGEACQLIMYSVSTRIVCKTGPSLVGPQAATVFVGNRAGVSSAHDKFHYKAVHLSDVNPKVGPVSGGTRLFLTGSNLNVGSRLQIYLDDIPCTVDASSHEFATSNQITCVTGPNLLATSSTRNITRLTLTVDNSTHHLPYPFAYQPDPIITSIEPAESFVSGGRLVLISGHHLASPQTVKLLVYHEHLGRHNILNGTTCITQNDTLITCLTPALSRDILANLQQLSADNYSNLALNDIMSYESGGGGLRLRMMLVMDDVKSVRNLDEYYHHLPHYLAYFDDPQLFRLPSQVVEYTGSGQELIIAGENLKMRQLDQDMLITVGNQNVCVIKSIQANQVVCEPPSKVAPVYDDAGRLVERPLLPIVGLIGANLRYPIGHMQYTSQQYLVSPQGQLNPQDNNHHHYQSSGGQQHHQYLTNIGQQIAAATSASGQASNFSILTMVLIMLSVVGFLTAFSATFVFALARFRQSKAEQEYKRIQLQMGSLDVNGQPVTSANGHLFDKIHFNSNNGGSGQTNNNLLLQQSRGGLVDYVGGALSGKKLFYQLNQTQVAGGIYQQQRQPASPLTDISSLIGSSPAHNNAHLVRLSSNGAIINATTTTQRQAGLGQQQNRSYYSALDTSQSGSSQQSSPNSARNNSPGGQPLVDSNTKTSLLATGHLNNHGQHRQATSNSRNFNWTQEAPSTIVPYAVIEACNLTLEGKNAIRDYV